MATTSTHGQCGTPMVSDWRSSAANRGDADIWLMDGDGKNLVNLTRAEGDDTSPAFSRDGKRLAFVSSRDGGSDIYVMDVK